MIVHFLLPSGPSDCFPLRLRTVASLLFLLVFAGQCQSQFRPPEVELSGQDSIGYSFINLGTDTIENAGYLQPVLHKLYLQRTRGGKKVNNVHIGDSHILGNFVTDEVRQHLQNAFGDGGRGLIFPYQLANSNGPRDYQIQTDNRWYGSNCQQNLADQTPYGISGFLAESFQKTGQLNIQLRDTSSAQSRLFTKVTIFYREDNGPVRFRVQDAVTNQNAELYLKDNFFQSFYFDQPVAQATITYEQISEQDGSFTLDGILLENELSGVIYHSIGVNGGKFSDFVRARFFARQVADLQPDLIILSFGTNEAQGKISTKYIYRQIDELVGQIKKYAPEANFLFTTPADSYLRGRGFNPYMRTVSQVIREFAREHGYALWDLYAIGGGERSAQQWKYSGLLSSDSVHYTRTGYSVQGRLLYQSLIRSYNNYARSMEAE